jgi:hypothetical protein
LTRQEQLNYFFSLYDSADPLNQQMDMNKLQGFFEMLKDIEDVPLDHKQQEKHDHEKIDVMIDDEIIMLESNSIRAIRSVISRFAEFGYILQRDHTSEKLFKRDKVTRYLRVFKIIDQIHGFGLS